LFLCVACTKGLMRSMSSEPAAMSTPASLYDIPELSGPFIDNACFPFWKLNIRDASISKLNDFEYHNKH